MRGGGVAADIKWVRSGMQLNIPHGAGQLPQQKNDADPNIRSCGGIKKKKKEVVEAEKL